MPSTRVLLTVAVGCLLLPLVVSTAATTLGEDHETDDIVLESTDSRYAAVEDDEIRLELEKLNDRAVTRANNVFTVAVTNDSVERVWIDHDVAGLSFYEGDDPTASVGESSPLEPAAGETTQIGVAVDTHVAQPATETFTVHVAYGNETDGSGPGAPGSEPGEGGNESDGTVGGGEGGGSGGGGGIAGSIGDPDPASGVSLVDFETSDPSFRAGDTLTATATYRNSGETSAQITAGLTIDGVVVDQRTVTVPPGETTTVTFERQLYWAGTYEIGIDGQATQTVTVDGPPLDINATVDDSTITVGESTTVTATVTNPTDESVAGPLEFAVDAIVVESRYVELEAGETRTMTFERQFDSRGTYDVAVSGVDAESITVSEPPFSIRNRDLSATTTAALAPPTAVGLLLLFGAVNRRWNE